MSLSVTRQDLEKMDEQYLNEMYKIFGYSLLTSPEGVDSSRLNMVSQNLKQFNVLLKPDYPRISTGFENTFGRYSHGYKKLEGKWKVIDKIYKYKENGVYMLVLYNKDTDTYDMIEKVFAVGFAEKQGYVYNTKVMDSLQVGDKVEDIVLYKTTSYDDQMNYRNGKSARVMNCTTNDTLEDGLRVRAGWAMECQFFEVESPVASVNNNDIPKNIHGTKDNYKPIPDIGESVCGKPLFDTMRINSKHILTEFREENLMDWNSTDSTYLTGKRAILYDIDIYYNGKDPFPDNIFFSQLKWYYDRRNEYAERIYEIATKIKHSGSNYTKHVTYYRSLYKKDPDEPWYNQKKFDYMVIEFHTVCINMPGLGSKLTGRYGNKGVISTFANDVDKETRDAVLDSFNLEKCGLDLSNLDIKIVPDEFMPFTDDGPIDILIDTSAAVRRLIMDSINEIEINFISSEQQKHLKTLETYEEKEALVFDYIEQLSSYEYSVLSKLFDREEQLDRFTIRYRAPEWKRRFIDSVEKNGFYIQKPPHNGFRYNEIKALYKRYPYIKPIPVYINAFGIKHRLMQDAVVGEMYFWILKQNTNKNFSVRSTYRINRAGLPAKDNGKKLNKLSYARTPIKLSEIYNLFASISGRTLAEWNIFMRSSTLGRMALSKILKADSHPLKIKKLNLKPEFVNTNAEMLQAKLKVIGIGLEFIREDDSDDSLKLTDEYPTFYQVDQYTIFDVREKRRMYQMIFRVYRRIRGSISFYGLSGNELEDAIWDKVFEDEELNAEFTIVEEDKEMLRNLTKAGVKAVDNDDDDEDNDKEGKVRRRRRRKKSEDDD